MAAGKVAEQVAVELEQVAGDLEQAASVARRVDGRVIGSLGIGLGAGAVIGFYFGYKYSKRKLRAEIIAEAERDITAVREHYQQKLVAMEAQDKAPVEAIVRERGYAPPEEEPRIEYSRLDDPTDPPEPQSIRSNIFTPPQNPGHNPTFRMPRAQKEKGDDWDWDTELTQRDLLTPFVLHQDEYETNESGYVQVSYVYYSRDDVLIDEDDPQTILHNRENLIGDTLSKFGHGADDYNTVYVRNSKLELEMVIHRVTGSWEEEVLGLDTHESG